MKRRKISVWGVFSETDGLDSFVYAERVPPDELNENESVVRLVEADPHADAVVRAAVKTELLWRKRVAVESRANDDRWRAAANAQSRAVERYLKGRK